MNQASRSNYEHRKGVITLNITDSDGLPIRNQAITVRQKKHQFLFGCGEFSAISYKNNEMEGQEKEKAEERFAKFFDLFNYATLPFYWGRFEPVKGQPDTRRLMQAAEWLKSEDMTLKGHPLCWHTVTAPWLMELSNEEIRKVQLERIQREVTGFAGVIDIWDVINEVVIMPIFNKYDNGITRICKDVGRIRLVREVFQAAKKSNPQATLLINDFNTSEAYDILVEGLLEAGVPIDAIGIQSHMHQGYWGNEKTEEILDRFSRFRLPLHFTENSLVSGHIMPPEIEDLNDYQIPEWLSTPEGEERQANEAILHYKTLFRHPMVQSVTWWDFIDGSWLGAPSGFITKDNRVKPIYHALHQLIKGEWWTGVRELMTDENGQTSVYGFLGQYEAEYAGKIADFVLDGKPATEVAFQ